MPDSLGLDTSIIPNWIKTLRHEEDHQALMILELAADLAGAPMAMINLRDGDQLKRWLSLDDNVQESVPINDALCGVAVLQASPLITCDARRQPELAGCSSVLADGIRYYIGLPLKADNGEIIGCMSLADAEPRQQLPSPDVLVRLDKLASLATEALKRQVNQSYLNAEFADSQSRASWILRSISDGIIEWKTGNERLTISTRLENQLGYEAGTLDTALEALHERVAPDMRDDFKALINTKRLSGTPFNCELLIRTQQGDHRWFELRAQFEVRNGAPYRFIGSLLDIHQQHLAKDAQADKLRRYERQQAALIELGNTRHDENAQLDSLLPWLCEQVAKGLQIRKVSFWYMNEDRDCLSLAHVHDAWVPPPHDATHSTVPTRLTRTQNRVYFEALDAGHALALADVTKANQELLFDGTFRCSVKAIIDSPIRVAGQVVAVICCTESNAPREWAEDEQAFLASVADHVSQLMTEFEQQASQKRLRASERRYRATFEHSAVGMAHLSTSGQLLRVNQRLESILGYTAATLSQSVIRELIEPEDLESFLQQHQALIEQRKDFFTQQCRFIHASGNSVHAEISVSAVEATPDQDGYTLLALIDNTLNHTMSQRMAHEANHDSLTGLLNRGAFKRELTTLCDDARATRALHCLAYIDLDQFKVVNDTCGHSAGDALLIQLVDVIAAGLRKQDRLARLGGDEFGLLMPDMSLDAAEALLEEMRQSVTNFRFMWEDKLFTISTSIGLVSIDSNHNDPHQLLSAADAACYEAKDAGRNRIHRHSESGDEVARRMQEMHWLTEITAAIEEQRLVLYQQPIVSTLATAQADNAEPGNPPHCEPLCELHYEVLVRLKGRDGTIIAPGAFLPAAERYGLSAAIDEHVIRQYLSWLAAHPAHAQRLTMVSLNLSGHSISSPSFRDLLVTLVRDSGIPGDKLCFEITESVAITRLGDARAFFEALGALGCSFALDDFGSGVSSFGYLKNLPVDFLKIDGAFIRDMDTNRVSYSIARAIAEVAREMGMKTVAEFVGSAQVLASVATIGADYVQGYALGMPEPLETIAICSNTDDGHGKGHTGDTDSSPISRVNDARVAQPLAPKAG
ncbi:EAL domain-containing protein [Cobetia litoralis]|nr:EAL domain-containing protein [Cobetia litoralis]MDH2421982.1 EAL domain-containing protein [Cobetia litoralis]